MFLTDKLGPLPLWGWGAAAGGGLLLMSAGGGKKKKDPTATDPNAAQNQPPGAPGASQAFMYGGSGNIYGGGDQAFGGGALGMYSFPYFGGSSMFVNLFRHPHGDSWRYGGHGFPFHAFDRFPFFHGGQGPDRDHREGRGQNFGHGGGDRGVGFGNDPYQYPRGGGGGQQGPGGTGGRSSRWADNNASSPGNHVR